MRPDEVLETVEDQQYDIELMRFCQWTLLYPFEERENPFFAQVYRFVGRFRFLSLLSFSSECRRENECGAVMVESQNPRRETCP